MNCKNARISRKQKTAGGRFVHFFRRAAPRLKIFKFVCFMRSVRFFAAPFLNLCIFLIKKLLFFKKRIMYTDIIKKGGA